MQIGDDGSVWNLYYCETQKKVFLRVNRKNISDEYVP
jgi:hypothetical protein